ncbi:TIGR02206 family membrane protein [Bacillus marinisedimentorum]|uniref:YwaF family protein n=1 Tax=Bacillus marinisedimentorum TaxID=1821260 RepID=UPI000873239F|nr:TIGR02206 family membrane protein [Bacillus marinisedimentorum]
MSRYFQQDGTKPFELFSTTHLLTLTALILILFFIFLFRKPLRQKRLNLMLRLVIFLALFISEISLHTWLGWVGIWDIRYSLPLHLSSLSLILSSILILTKSYFLFEFTYFAGVGSALQAMITPDLSQYTFPHFRYIHFFVSHGAIVAANVWMIFVEKFKPTARSLWRAFLILNIYTFLIFILNFLLNGNYMFISKKPVNPSIIDYLGPWPFYIIPLEMITLLTFWLLYLPFMIANRKKGSGSN